MHERWLLERAMALLAVLLDERDRKARCLVTLPPEGASLLEIERAALVSALERTNWNQTAAAKLLGITPRVMHYKCNRYELYDESPKMKRRDKQIRTTPWRHRKPREAGKDWRVQPWQQG